MDRKLIEQYADGGNILVSAIQGLTTADFLAAPVPGTWSIQQIVVHLMDSDLIATDRMKRIAAEDHPTIIGYNETLWSNNLSPEKLDPFKAAELFRLNRELTAVVLGNLPDAAFKKTGTHNEAGVISLAYLVENYVKHLNHHLTFLRHKRQLLGKAL